MRSPFQRIAAGFRLAFPIQRIVLVSAVLFAVIHGTIFQVFPYEVRYLFAWIFLGLTGAVGYALYGTFKPNITMVVQSWLQRKSYPPASYETLGVARLRRKMGLKANTKVELATNPKIGGAFTNALTGTVTIPAHWVRSKFPEREILGIVAHEFGHIRTRRRFFLEFFGCMVVVAVLASVLALRTITLVVAVFEIALLLLLFTLVSWRNEYRADQESAKFVDPAALMSSLEWLAWEDGVDEGSATHPPAKKRIDRLSGLLKENHAP